MYIFIKERNWTEKRREFYNNSTKIEEKREKNDKKTKEITDFQYKEVNGFNKKTNFSKITKISLIFKEKPFNDKLYI